MNATDYRTFSERGCHSESVSRCFQALPRDLADQTDLHSNPLSSAAPSMTIRRECLAIRIRSLGHFAVLYFVYSTLIRKKKRAVHLHRGIPRCVQHLEDNVGIAGICVFSRMSATFRLEESHLLPTCGKLRVANFDS